MCDKCKDISIEHENYKFCPYCGGELHDFQSMVETIKKIMEYCASHDNCDSCFFSGETSRCALENLLPCDWEI